MMTKNNNSKYSIFIIFIILAIILDLAFLYFIKYHNQSLGLKDFNLRSFGNIANMLFAFLIIFGLLIDQFTQRIIIKTKAFLIIFWLTQFFLVAAYLSTIISPSFKNIYFLGQNGNRLFIGSLFTLYNFLYFVLVFMVWLVVIRTKNLILLRSMLDSLLLMLFILIIVFFFILKKEAGLNDKNITRNPNNIGVVLGAAVWSNNKPSPSLSARVDEAINLYEQKKISAIYLTGSNAPGELAESEVALNYIKSTGKSISNIYIETGTTSTNEQIQFIKNNLLVVKSKNVVVISDSYHLVRVLEIGKFQNMNLIVAPSDLSLSFEKSLYNKAREALALTVFWFFAI
jgi:vancomycin permeability regulator SanA